MRAAVAVIWVGAIAGLAAWRPEPLVVLLVLQAAVCLSYLVLCVSGSPTEVAGLLERQLVGVATALWRAVDQIAIESAVDGVGRIVSGWSTVLRRAQAGSVRVHAAAALGGVLAMIGYLLWR